MNTDLTHLGARHSAVVNRLRRRSDYSTCCAKSPLASGCAASTWARWSRGTSIITGSTHDPPSPFQPETPDPRMASINRSLSFRIATPVHSWIRVPMDGSSKRAGATVGPRPRFRQQSRHRLHASRSLSRSPHSSDSSVTSPGPNLSLYGVSKERLPCRLKTNPCRPCGAMLSRALPSVDTNPSAPASPPPSSETVCDPMLESVGVQCPIALRDYAP